MISGKGITQCRDCWKGVKSTKCVRRPLYDQMDCKMTRYIYIHGGKKCSPGLRLEINGRRLEC